jgi:hypothetical protein
MQLQNDDRIPCERPTAWHTHIKNIFDQSGVGRVQEAFKNNSAGKPVWKKLFY